MKKIGLAVFDMAGTTVYDNGAIAEAFQTAFAKKGLSIPIQDINKVMGWRKIEAITRLLQEHYPESSVDSVHIVDAINADFQKILVDFYECDKQLRPLPYAEEVFALLKGEGIKIALNTGFTRLIADIILRRLNWKSSPLIDATICSDEVSVGRPAPEMIQELMRILGIAESKKVAKVGDTAVDILEGRNAKCGKVIGVATGAYTKEDLIGYEPDAIIESLSELPSILLGH